MSLSEIFRIIYIEWSVRSGKAINIWSNSSYPANVLSNLYPNEFEYDGVFCGSMEGFLQSLKYKDVEEQRHVCTLSGKEAKQSSIEDWKEKQLLYWKGTEIKRISSEFDSLIRDAYLALYNQNATFRKALKTTQKKNLFHYQGKKLREETILTEKEFIDNLDWLRRLFLHN